MIDRQRMVQEFLALAATGSVSRREAGIAKLLVQTLEGLGATVEVDDAGPKA